MPKQREHNEYFRTVSLNNRKSCPTCHTRLHPGESIWNWGEYVSAKWRTVKYFCSECFIEQVQRPLWHHNDDRGCTINLVG